MDNDVILMFFWVVLMSANVYAFQIINDVTGKSGYFAMAVICAFGIVIYLTLYLKAISNVRERV